MRLIAMLNQKGGVGKTTTAVNVAAGLARERQRVLLIDLDPQSHATMHFGIEPSSEQPSIYDVLVNGNAAADALRPVSDDFAVLPAHIDLVGAELELGGIPERELILRRALEPLHGRFDILIIDCPPSLGTLTINALAAVEEVIIPLQPHFLALQGLGRLLETVSLVRGVLNPALRIAGVILCMHEKGTRLAQEVDKDVREFIASASPEHAWHGARVFDACIRRNVKLAECPSFGQTIFEYAPSSHGAEDYTAVVRELLGMTTDIAREPAGQAVGGDADSAGPDAISEAPVVRQAGMDVDVAMPPGTAAPAAGPSELPESPARPFSSDTDRTVVHDAPSP